MKRKYITPALAAFAAFTLAYGAAALADETVTTSTTSAGTISEFSPDTIIIKSETSPEPIRYGYSTTTTYVDDAGAPVSREIIKSGVPVTIHYVREGDRVIANRVIVHIKKTTVAPAAVEETRTSVAPAVIEERRAPVAPAVVEEKRTTTTTTTGKEDKRDRKERKEQEKEEKKLDK